MTWEQFLERVEKTESCWLWMKCVVLRGLPYGRVKFQGKVQLAHRVAFFLVYKRWPRPKCLHRCDNPRCVRPNHLFEGTQQDNVLDSHRKQRATHKLAPEQVLTIRSSSELQRKLAVKYGVTQSAISMAKTGTTYGWIECATPSSSPPRSWRPSLTRTGCTWFWLHN